MDFIENIISQYNVKINRYERNCDDLFYKWKLTAKLTNLKRLEKIKIFSEKYYIILIMQ